MTSIIDAKQAIHGRSIGSTLEPLDFRRETGASQVNPVISGNLGEQIPE